jgi:hypothetical protein
MSCTTTTIPRAEETKERIKQYGAAKLKTPDDYLPQLAKKFGASLRLADFLRTKIDTS